MCSCAHMDSRGNPARSHKSGIKTAGGRLEGLQAERARLSGADTPGLEAPADHMQALPGIASAPSCQRCQFTCIRAGGAYDFDAGIPLPRDQSSKPAVMERRTKTSSRAIPGEAASLSERRARKASFSPRRRASDSMLMITKSPERDPLIPK